MLPLSIFIPFEPGSAAFQSLVQHGVSVRQRLKRKRTVPKKFLTSHDRKIEAGIVYVVVHGYETPTGPVIGSETEYLTPQQFSQVLKQVFLSIQHLKIFACHSTTFARELKACLRPAPTLVSGYYGDVGEHEFSSRHSYTWWRGRKYRASQCRLTF